MNRRQITGYSNPTIKAVRALREKKHRKREGRFLAEGLRLLTKIINLTLRQLIDKLPIAQGNSSLRGQRLSELLALCRKIDHSPSLRIN